MNIAVKQPTILLISLFIPAILFMENAQSQTTPLIKGQSVFAPYQPEPKFAPARGGQTQSTSAFDGKEGSNRQSSEPLENQTSNQSNGQPNSQTSEQSHGPEPFSVTPDGVPALNIVPTVDRPPIPPPPNAAPLRPRGSGIARPAQAWRVKAFQLFKQKIDPNTTISMVLNANYNNVLPALRQTFEEEGLTISGFSASSGHMLIIFNSSNSASAGNSINSRSEKAFVALRSALPRAIPESMKKAVKEAKTEAKANSKAEAKTELRVMCESRNKSLTCLRMKEILNKLQNKFGDIKIDAETL